MADSNNADKKGGNMKILIIALAGGLLLAVAGGAGVWFFMGGTTPTATESGPVAVPLGPVEYLSLAPAFVVNFPHQGRQRFMQADVTVMSRDAQALAAVRQHMPAIRHSLINLFSAQLLLVFEDPTGIERLRQLATEEVNQVLEREIGRRGVDEVLFTSFVMQ
jgi:flagellar FliL protein